MTKDDLDKKAVAISTAIEHEKSRVLRLSDCGPESISYEPALNEVLLYLEKYSNSESASEAYSAIYDAEISIEYYLADLES